MGAVHGCYLKYVGLSLTSWALASLIHPAPDLTRRALDVTGDIQPWRLAGATALYYSCLVNGVIAVLFRSRRFTRIIGKDSERGTIPLWSYCIFAPFHIPTMLYTYVHVKQMVKKGIPVASEVVKGWWIGGRYSHLLERKWSCVVDLTVEFPELCRAQTESYVHVPLWDGNPPTPELLEHAASTAAAALKKGGSGVLVHCAHGVGRSTTVMCACLVRVGKFSTWEEAFEAWLVFILSLDGSHSQFRPLYYMCYFFSHNIVLCTLVTRC